MPPATIHAKMCRALFNHIVYSLVLGECDRWECKQHPGQDLTDLGYCPVCYPDVGGGKKPAAAPTAATH
jgi:hypothetical protein